MSWFSHSNRNLVFSYLALRRLIGIIGLIFPLLLISGGFFFGKYCVLTSLSSYYYSNMRDLFVGLLMVLGFFLITYKGYSRLDNIINSASGIFALTTASFPCLTAIYSRVGIFQLPPGISNCIHLSSAVLFLLLLGINSFFLFTKTKHKGSLPKAKYWRNVVYRVCGLLIFIIIFLLGLLTGIMGWDWLEKHYLILIAEALMLFAFGSSWLVKGQTLLRD